MLHEIQFRAMGTTVQASLFSNDADRANAALGTVPVLFEEIEQELSRFRPDSGLCRLNAAAGRGPQRVSPILAEVCSVALKAAYDTEGLFDPTVLPALEQGGYDDSFAVVAQRPDPGAPEQTEPTRAYWREVVVEGDCISLPAGAALDLGGVAKGWAADFVADALRPFGPAMVNAGGDLRTTGMMGDEPWSVALADPHQPDYDVHEVELADEAVTTSSVGKRRWLRQGVWMHHLIDPETQLPSASDAHTVTVVGPTATECDITAKVVLLLGLEEGAAFLEQSSLEGILFGHQGETRTVGDRFKSFRPHLHVLLMDDGG